MRLHFPALIGLAAVGCAYSSKVAPPVTLAMVSAAHGASAETLGEGRRIFAGPCTACHAADPVESRSPAEWRAVVDEMSLRTKLTADRRAALLAYLLAAKAAPATQ